MVDVARVNLYGQPIGSVRWDQRYEIAQFEYDPDFVRLGIEPSPLMMPVREGRVYSFGELDRTTFKGLPGMLADSLPDTYGRTLFERWLALTGRTSGNTIETLCFLGKRCMGALEFELRRFVFWANAAWEHLNSSRPSMQSIRISGLRSILWWM